MIKNGKLIHFCSAVE